MALTSVPATPWRNGGGVTRELLAWPTAQEWTVRLSVADVEQDGPFSRFDGVQRWFAVLDGAGVRLDVAGQCHQLSTSSAPLCFDGAAPTHCKLIAGATRDFNLMVRGHTARLERVNGAHDGRVTAGCLIAGWSGRESATAILGDDTTELAPHTLAWRLLTGDGQARFTARDGLWMEVAV
jgi:uncharacterized protein